MTYQREVLRWNPGANAGPYCDAADAAYAAYTGIPGDIFCYRNRYDRHGQQITPYFGPTGLESAEAPGPAEPAECLALRGDAELVATVEWPNEE